MENKRLNKNVNIFLTLGIIFAVGLVVGIPTIVLSAINSFWVGLVLGIVLLACGFYGTPIIFIVFASTKQLKRVLDAITEENLYSVQAIASHLQLSEKEIREKIFYAINKKYLLGFVFDGANLTPNNPKIDKSLQGVIKCPNCGAPLHKVTDGKVCPYCGVEF